MAELEGTVTVNAAAAVAPQGPLVTNGQAPSNGALSGPAAGVPPIDPSELTPVLKLRGLPYSATQDEIAKWFAAANLPVTPITSANVHLVVHADGRSSGEAFVEFASPDDAKQGMALHKHMLGNRYIEIFMSTPQEIARAGGQY
eukprot:jgi/Botrbrau1/15530/Bobra.0123s0006.1